MISKIIIVLIIIVVFTILYKCLLNQYATNKYSWFDAFYNAVFNQTFTYVAIREECIKIPTLIQNVISFTLVLGLFVMLIG